MQKTLKKTVRFEGIGLHSGALVSILVHPAPEGHGIVFERSDIPSGPNLIPAIYSNVSDTRLNTRIANEHGVEISTIEHLMAAFAGLGITNALVSVDNIELPILDGSSYEYVEAFWQAGIAMQNRPVKLYKVVKALRIEREDGAFVELSPSDEPIIEFTIEYNSPLIGQQSLALNMANGTFLRELANCRTFCMLKDVEAMQASGLALGGNLDNAVVIDQDQVLNPEGLRHADEFVRHKILDALGDLSLCGGVFWGRYQGFKSGHGLTNLALRKAFEEGAIIEMVSNPQMVGGLPGADVEPSDFAA